MCFGRMIFDVLSSPEDVLFVCVFVCVEAKEFACVGSGMLKCAETGVSVSGVEGPIVGLGCSLLVVDIESEHEILISFDRERL